MTAKILTKDRTVYGQPLGWDKSKFAMLELDGKFSFVPGNSKDDLEIVAKKFAPYSSRQLATKLQSEFGARYDVSVTRNFVVVHPQGKKDYWAMPFEDFYSRFEYFFSNHNVELTRSPFPLVVVILRSRKDFDLYMHNQARLHNRAVVGFYSRISNRMVTYDPAQMLRVKSDSWLYRSDTVIHESTHQLAFNRGLHNRFAPPPLWLSEGLAMLFEARGFHHSEEHPEVGDRVARERYETIKAYYLQKKVVGRLPELIASDVMFRKDPELAYSLAWAVNFYLYETRQEAYLSLLREQGQRRNFKMWDAENRLKSFVSRFGNDFADFESKMKDYFLPATKSVDE